MALQEIPPTSDSRRRQEKGAKGKGYHLQPRDLGRRYYSTFSASASGAGRERTKTVEEMKTPDSEPIEDETTPSSCSQTSAGASTSSRSSGGGGTRTVLGAGSGWRIDGVGARGYSTSSPRSGHRSGKTKPPEQDETSSARTALDENRAETRSCIASSFSGNKFKRTAENSSHKKAQEVTRQLLPLVQGATASRESSERTKATLEKGIAKNHNDNATAVASARKTEAYAKSLLVRERVLKRFQEQLLDPAFRTRSPFPAAEVEQIFGAGLTLAGCENETMQMRSSAFVKAVASHIFRAYLTDTDFEVGETVRLRFDLSAEREVLGVHVQGDSTVQVVVRNTLGSTAEERVPGVQLYKLQRRGADQRDVGSIQRMLEHVVTRLEDPVKLVNRLELGRSLALVARIALDDAVGRDYSSAIAGGVDVYCKTARMAPRWQRNWSLMRELLESSEAVRKMWPGYREDLDKAGELLSRKLVDYHAKSTGKQASARSEPPNMIFKAKDAEAKIEGVDTQGAALKAVGDNKVKDEVGEKVEDTKVLDEAQVVADRGREGPQLEDEVGKKENEDSHLKVVDDRAAIVRKLQGTLSVGERAASAKTSVKTSTSAIPTPYWESAGADGASQLVCPPGRDQGAAQYWLDLQCRAIAERAKALEEDKDRKIADIAAREAGLASSAAALVTERSKLSEAQEPLLMRIQDLQEQLASARQSAKQHADSIFRLSQSLKDAQGGLRRAVKRERELKEAAMWREEEIRKEYEEEKKALLREKVAMKRHAAVAGA
ncbi:unnamed protein product [Amoebophrya sp. A25]|nr:unnamed protein product [Amoebophrya sp. A25]|eukprot:GSA25T00006901001.1